MKKIVSILILIALIISCATISRAADASMSLSPDKTKAEKGAEVKVSIIINNFTREGTQKAVEAKITYDNQKLEYKGINWGEDWTGEISGDGTGMAANKSVELSTQEKVAEITYTVKENAEIGNTVITADEIITSSDGDEVSANSVSTTIEIVEADGNTEDPENPEGKELSSIEITTKPTKTEYTEGESFDPAGMVITAKYSDGSSKEVQAYIYSPSGVLKTSDKEIIISYTEGETTKTVTLEITVESKADDNDSGNGGTNNSGNGGTNNSGNNGTTSGNKTDNTTSEKDYPKTGAKTVILPICILAVFATVSYIKYRKYKVI